MEVTWSWVGGAGECHVTTMYTDGITFLLFPHASRAGCSTRLQDQSLAPSDPFPHPGATQRGQLSCALPALAILTPVWSGGSDHPWSSERPRSSAECFQKEPRGGKRRAASAGEGHGLGPAHARPARGCGGWKGSPWSSFCPVARPDLLHLGSQGAGCPCSDPTHSSHGGHAGAGLSSPLCPGAHCASTACAVGWPSGSGGGRCLLRQPYRNKTPSSHARR